MNNHRAVVIYVMQVSDNCTTYISLMSLFRLVAQEEVILYNSDGYRALLDLKYQRMCGGYAIPEFGLAYVRNMRFFDVHDGEKYRKTDMLVSACYCLNGSELYNNPGNDDEVHIEKAIRNN